MELRHLLPARRPAGHPRLTPDELRRRAGGDAAGAVTGDVKVEESGTHVPAAVLVGLVPGAEGGVLLTKRTAALRRHSGQVSFPGGRIDPGDASPEAAALREAEEEVGLDPASVEPIGRLADYVTVTGYRVTPVVALLSPDPRLTLSPAEVEAAFLLPFTTLLDPTAPVRQSAVLHGATRQYWTWPHPDHTVWGATAAMLVMLADRLRGPRRSGKDLEV